MPEPEENVVPPKKKQCRWTTKQVDCLVAYWKENQEGLSSSLQRVFWDDIAKHVSKSDPHVPSRSAQDCREKIKNMKQYYQKVKDSTGRTGAAANFPKYYDDFDEILGTKDATTLPEMKQIGLKRKHEVDMPLSSCHTSPSTSRST